MKFNGSIVYQNKNSKNILHFYKYKNHISSIYLYFYAGILDERLKAETENKLGESQFRFRRERGAMDAVYVLKHILDKQVSKGKGKLFACFADLKAAFDRVDRGKLVERMRKMGINEKLTRRVKEIYEDTRNIVRIGNQETREFWTVKGVRQGCPLSPALFNVYVAGLEEELRKGQAEGIVVGNRKVWSLSYADDIVLIADREEELKEMMKRFEAFLKNAELELNTEKTKIIAFERRKNKRRQRTWRWGGQEIEEVEETRYLGYILQKNGGDEKHIQGRKKRATVAMKKTWSIGERAFRSDFKRRMEMFRALAESVALFGAEVWGWNEEKKLDKVKRRYTKWILGLEITTPNHILIEESKITEIGEKALKRAARYEEKALVSKKELVKECIKERERNWGKVKAKRGKEQEKERRG